MQARQIRQTATYVKWFNRLRDPQTRARILVRIRRLSLGNPGYVESVGQGVRELKIHHGPGYRIYFMEQERSLVILLAGGDKRTQKKDIRKAIALARALRK